MDIVPGSCRADTQAKSWPSSLPLEPQTTYFDLPNIPSAGFCRLENRFFQHPAIQNLPGNRRSNADSGADFQLVLRELEISRRPNYWLIESSVAKSPHMTSLNLLFEAGRVESATSEPQSFLDLQAKFLLPQIHILPLRKVLPHVRSTADSTFPFLSSACLSLPYRSEHFQSPCAWPQWPRSSRILTNAELRAASIGDPSIADAALPSPANSPQTIGAAREDDASSAQNESYAARLSAGLTRTSRADPCTARRQWQRTHSSSEPATTAYPAVDAGAKPRRARAPGPTYPGPKRAPPRCHDGGRSFDTRGIPAPRRAAADALPPLSGRGPKCPCRARKGYGADRSVFAGTPRPRLPAVGPARRAPAPGRQLRQGAADSLAAAQLGWGTPDRLLLLPETRWPRPENVTRS